MIKEEQSEQKVQVCHWTRIAYGVIIIFFCDVPNIFNSLNIKMFGINI